VIVSYEDRPHNFDAWDVNHYYTEKSWEVDALSEMTLVENGPVRACVKLVRPYLDSTITQYIYLYREIPRIDIRHVIDWKEHQIFLKEYFPVDVHTDEATYEIQYGNVKRPTHANTSWDMAKFEVCHHKWMDLSEDGYGVSVLNDCKFGVSVQDSVIGLSMIKSAMYPNPAADKEVHEFTYSLYPHEDSWKAAGTVEEAYMLNNPLHAVRKTNEGGVLPAQYSMVSVNRDNVVIEVMKQAESGEDTILRLYECHNRRTPVTLTFGRDIEEASEVNMMEEDPKPISREGRELHFTMKPYEITTIRVKMK
jgi:alpha-mannosidase